MHKTLSVCAVAALAAFGTSVQAQEVTARVISATPIVQQVPTCNNQPIAVPPPSTGGGALVGAITGGLLGSLVGGGFGTVVATGLGIVGGAAVGDNLERRGPPMLIAQGCANQPYAENRTVGYNVTYEYNGAQQTVQMANDPGPTVRLQMGPNGPMVAQSNGYYPQPNGYQQPNGYYPQPNGYRQPYVNAPAYGYPSGSANVVQAPGQVDVGPNAIYPASPAPAYGYPAYSYPAYGYPASYYPAYYPGYAVAPIAVSLGFGYSNWGHGGHRHYGGYRGYRR